MSLAEDIEAGAEIERDNAARTPQPCWFIHEPADDGGIVCDARSRQIMFSSELQAIEFRVANHKQLQGFVVQRDADSAEFIRVSDMDGVGAVWYEHADFGK